MKCLLCGNEFIQEAHSECMEREKFLADYVKLDPNFYCEWSRNVTELRAGVYVNVSWLSKLMAGEVQCQWGSWFKAHYGSYTKAPSTFERATWLVEHNKCLNELCIDLKPQVQTLYKETQNKFTVKRKGMAIQGTPDLVVINKDGNYTVYDQKTGKPGPDDVIQVMLYMALLPWEPSRRYKGKSLNGCVVYKNGEKTPIPASAASAPAFLGQITHFLDILGTATAPSRTPSFMECRFCEITSEDCTERIEKEPDKEENEDLPI